MLLVAWGDCGWTGAVPLERGAYLAFAAGEGKTGEGSEDTFPTTARGALVHLQPSRVVGGVGTESANYK